MPHSSVEEYNAAQSPADRAICQLLAEEITRHLPEAEHKIWHAHPVWFLDGNPIVGYSKLKNSVRLLFWSGQSFDEAGLAAEGTFKAAEARYTKVDDVDTKVLQRWLAKARDIQWDYKNIVRRKGRLERLETSPAKPAPRARTARKPAAGATAGPKTGPKTGPTTGSATQDASRLIDQRIRDLGGWRGETLARMRKLVLDAAPGTLEEWKWNNPVWSHGGIVCTGEAYQKVVKLTFARGASVPDPSHLFNSSLTGKTRRAIDIREGEKVDARAFKALVKAAVALNGPKGGTGGTTASKRPRLRLLAGGNPQVAKADGDAPVQAYIAAMPGWKRELGARLDAIISRAVPNVRKAVKWNSPLYGIEGQGWFLSFHVYTHYVKVTFFRGTSLQPVPPGGTPRSKDARWIDLREGDRLDERQFAAWVRQGAALPGWTP